MYWGSVRRGLTRAQGVRTVRTLGIKKQSAQDALVRLDVDTSFRVHVREISPWNELLPCNGDDGDDPDRTR